MPDVTAESPNPQISFIYNSGGSVIARNRIRSYGLDDFRVDVWNGVSSTYDSLFKFTSSGNFSTEDLTIDKGTPRLFFTHTSGSQYKIESDGVELDIRIFSGDVDLRLGSDACQLTFGAGTNDFAIKKSGSALLFQDLSGAPDTIAQIDGDYLYGNKGIGAGGTNLVNVLKWQRYTGTLPASGTAISLTGYTGKIVGATVMLSTGSNSQSNNSFNLYDYRAGSVAGPDFWVNVGRNPAAGPDTITINYGASYTAGSSLYHIVAFFEP